MNVVFFHRNESVDEMNFESDADYYSFIVNTRRFFNRVQIRFAPGENPHFPHGAVFAMGRGLAVDYAMRMLGMQSVDSTTRAVERSNAIH